MDVLKTEINTLSSDLLIGFNNLEWFRMNDNNQLISIGSKILEPLKKVRFLEMRSNKCINVAEPSLEYGSNQILRNCFSSYLEQTDEELNAIEECIMPKRMDNMAITLKNCLSVMEVIETEMKEIKDQYTVTVDCLFDNNED